MSTIAAGTSTSTALVSSGDTTGNLVLQVNGTTPSLTLNAAGAHGVGSSPSYGTAGQVLTSAGSAASPTWATATSANGGTTASGSVVLTSASAGSQAITTTAYGQSVTLPSATTMTKSSSIFNINNAGGYPLKVLNNASSILGFIYPNIAADVGLADNSTAAGVWNITGLAPTAVTAEYVNTTATTTDNGAAINRVVLDANRTLILSGSGSQNLYGIIYDASTLTWGTLTLIRTAGSNNKALLTATNQVLVVSCNATTAIEAVVLTLSGTTITVNTAATATASATVTFNDFVAIGTSYVIGTGRATTTAIQAITISGTTPTIGLPLTLSGTVASADANFLFAVSASVILAFNIDASVIYASPVTVSGTTLTAGTAALITQTSTSSFRVFVLGSRWCVAYAQTTTYAAIVSVSGTIATASSVQIASTVALVYSSIDYLISGSKVIFLVVDASTISFNILTDSAGTALAGTPLLYSYASVSSLAAISLTGNNAIFVTGGTLINRYVIDISSTSPTLINYAQLTGSASFNGAAAVSTARGIRNQNWSKGTTNYTFTNSAVRTTAITANNLTSVYLPYQPGLALKISGYNNESWGSGSFISGVGVVLQRVEGVS